MSLRRSGILVSKKEFANVLPISTVCQVCNHLDSLYSCKICSRITCVNCKIICNDNTYCKICYFDNDVNNLIIIDIAQENKITTYKKLKYNFLYFISCIWISKNYDDL